MNYFSPHRTLARGVTRESGFSMAELLITVAVIGIMSAISVSAFKNVREGSRLGVAREVVNNLNSALADYSQINWAIDVTAQADESDEEWILWSLQWRDPTDPALGAPYMNPTWIPVVSSDTADHRAQWSGKVFELLLPGEAGTGLRINFEGGSDMGNYIVHPGGFYPVPPGTQATCPTF